VHLGTLLALLAFLLSAFFRLSGESAAPEMELKMDIDMGIGMERYQLH
jgi:hypothetical protein